MAGRNGGDVEQDAPRVAGASETRTADGQEGTYCGGIFGKARAGRSGGGLSAVEKSGVAASMRCLEPCRDVAPPERRNVEARKTTARRGGAVVNRKAGRRRPRRAARNSAAARAGSADGTANSVSRRMGWSARRSPARDDRDLPGWRRRRHGADATQEEDEKQPDATPLGDFSWPPSGRFFSTLFNIGVASTKFNIVPA
jgi:hypothetical protein